MVLLYQKMATNVGQDIYVCIQCFKEEYPGQEEWSAYRQSSPYVLSRQLGTRKVIPGSVCESLRNLHRELEQLATELRDRVARIQGAEGEQRAQEYHEYDRHLTNRLVLISCLGRNLFHTFPRLSEQFSVPMFDYEGNATAKVRVKNLLDLFVHNRYMNLHNEYIADLVSEKLPDGTVIADDFMGHRFRVEDFLSEIRSAIENVTIKDLGTRLRAGVKALDLDSPYQDIVFLVQNTESFSDLLEATIPSGSYDFILNLLFPATEIPEAVRSAAKDGEIQQEVRFQNPHVSIGDRLEEKKVRIIVKGEAEYSIGGRVVHRTSEERRKELDYSDFFDWAVRTFGQKKLMDLVGRIEDLRKGMR